MLIFLYGPDTYRSGKKLKELRDKFLREVDKSGLNLVILDGEKISAGELSSNLRASAFLAPKRMIIVKNALVKNDAEVQKTIIEFSKSDSENIGIFYEGEIKETKKGEVLKKLKESKYSYEFPSLKANEVFAFVSAEVGARDGKIESSAISRLALAVGPDTWRLATEIDKLVSYAKDRSITSADVDLMIDANIEDNIFKLGDALATKNRKEALRAIEEQFSHDKNGIFLLSMIIRHFRILVQVKDLLAQNPGMSPDDISSQIGIHRYPAQKAMGQVGLFTMPYLAAIYRYLVSLDRALKNSYGDPKLLLETFVAKI